MTREALRLVDGSRVFEATRPFEELSLHHVPFDDLNSDSETEAVLTRIVASHGRAAIIGPSGSGKSSLISAILGPMALDLPENMVPLRVPVATESDETETDPGAMARHLVRYITRWASSERFSAAERDMFLRGVAELTRHSGKDRRRKYHVGLPLWLANVEFAREVEITGQEYESTTSGADALEYLKRMVALFEAHSLFPVFVFDDSDTWLRIPDLDRTAVANGFFMRTVRVLIKELAAGLVLAVHEDYLDLAGYQEAITWFSGEVAIPRLREPRAAIDSILQERLRTSETQVQLNDVLEKGAIEQLALYYDKDRAIRDVLRVAHRALQHALSDGVELINASLLEQAISELSDRR